MLSPERRNGWLTWQRLVLNEDGGQRFESGFELLVDYIFFVPAFTLRFCLIFSFGKFLFKFGDVSVAVIVYVAVAVGRYEFVLLEDEE